MGVDFDVAIGRHIFKDFYVDECKEEGHNNKKDKHDKIM